MEDRELLELAAKAAGLKADDNMRLEWNGVMCQFPADWNPLEDDGDALRLAVQLRIEVEPWVHGDDAYARTAIGEVLIDEPHCGNPSAATRRAIVRAAAELGSRSNAAVTRRAGEGSD